MKPIIVDAMGGDYAPAEAVAGIAEYARENPETPVVLVGNEPEIAGVLKQHMSGGFGKVSIRHAADKIGMCEDVKSLRKKKESSMSVGVKMVKEGEGSAFVSLGNTAATVALCHITWGLLKGVSRAGIAIPIPRVGGMTLAIDMGANVNSKPDHLFDLSLIHISEPTRPY